MATSGNAKTLFRLPLEKLCGQIAAVAQVVLEKPEGEGHKSVLRVLAGRDEEIQRRVDRLIGLDEYSDDSSTSSNKIESDDEAELRGRLSHAIQRNIDAFQTATGYRWRFYVQAALLVFSGIMLWYLAFQFDVDTALMEWPMLAMGIIFARFVATTARDLLSTLERIRR